MTPYCVLRPEAEQEFDEALNYYLAHASAKVAERFERAIREALDRLVHAPTRWPVVAAPYIRRSMVQKFPYVLYYIWRPDLERITIYAVAHTRRNSGYWRGRVD